MKIARSLVNAQVVTEKGAKFIFESGRNYEVLKVVRNADSTINIVLANAEQIKNVDGAAFEFYNVLIEDAPKLENKVVTPPPTTVKIPEVVTNKEEEGSKKQ